MLLQQNRAKLAEAGRRLVENPRDGGAVGDGERDVGLLAAMAPSIVSAASASSARAAAGR